MGKFDDVDPDKAPTPDETGIEDDETDREGDLSRGTSLDEQLDQARERRNTLLDELAETDLRYLELAQAKVEADRRASAVASRRQALENAFQGLTETDAVSAPASEEGDEESVVTPPSEPEPPATPARTPPLFERWREARQQGSTPRVGLRRFIAERSS